MVDWEEWAVMEGTRAFRKRIKGRIADLEEGLCVDQSTLSFESAESTAIRTAMELGKIQALREVLGEL